MATGTDGTNGRLARWSLAGVGLLLVGFVVVASTLDGEPLLAQPLEDVGPVGAALAVVGAGVYVLRAGYDPGDVVLLSQTSLGVAALFGVLSAWSAFLLTMEGVAFGETTSVFVTFAVGVGGATGVALGEYDRRQRRATEEAELVTRAVSESSDGIAVLEDGRHVFVNDAYADLYGVRKPADLLGEPWTDRLGAGEAERFEREGRPALEQGGVWRAEMTGKRADGTTFHQELSLGRSAEGRTVCVVRDVTDQKRWEDDLETLLESVRELTEMEDREELSEWVVSIVQRLLGYPLVGIWTYDETREVLVPTANSETAEAIVAEHGFDGLPAFEPGTAEFRLFREGELTVVEEYERLENRAVPEVPIGSLIVLPIDGEAMVHAATTDVEAVSAGQRRLLELLGLNLEAAFERVDRENQLAAIHDASRELSYASTQEEVAEVTVDIAERVLDKPLSTVWKHDPGTGTLQLAAMSESTRRFIGEAELAELPAIGGEDLGMEVFEAGELRVVEDYGTVENPAFPNLPLGTVILVPLGEFGLLEVGQREVESVGNVDRYHAEILGANVVAALDSAEREQLLKRRQRALQRLQEASQEMVSAEDSHRVCELATETATDAIGVDFAGLWLVDDTGDRLLPATEPPTVGVGEPPTYSEGDGSVAWRVFEQQHMERIEPRHKEDETTHTDHRFRSELLLPVGAYGVLWIGSNEHDGFDESDTFIARLLAATTGSALERADREAELRTRADQMEFFNSILRHDVLNGMTVIRGRAQFLADVLEGDQRRHADTILRWSDDITDIVERVRSVLATLTGTEEGNLKLVDLAPLVTEECERVRATYPGVTVETDLPEQVPVLADELLAEVVGNLVTNAVEHNDTEGLRVRVSASIDAADGWATLRVVDNGVGIPEEDREAVFRRGRTGHAKSTGSGFGLFFVDSMIDAYGGEIHIEEGPSGGAAFVLKLPTGPGAVAQPEER